MQGSCAASPLSLFVHIESRLVYRLPVWAALLELLVFPPGLRLVFPGLWDELMFA